MIGVTHTEPYSGPHTCDRCPAPATVAQWWYRGNSDDRHGPLTTLRCSDHRRKA